MTRIRTAIILAKLEMKTDAYFTIYTLLILLAELTPFVFGVMRQFFSISFCISIIDWLTIRINPELIKENASIIISVETAYMGAAIAGTVFFYSIMDSGRIGIPYRKIMNYKYGTLSVSASIVLSVISLFASILSYLSGKYYVWCGAGTTMVLLQSSVLWRVLNSTTYRTNANTITAQERKQLKFLTDNRNELEQLNIRYELRIDSFMGRIASSNAVTTDKTNALRKLLNVPYKYYKSIKNMSMEKLFQVYYINFRDVFVKTVQNEEQTDTVYELFFEMVSDKEKNDKEIVFWPMITAAWYAAFIYKPKRYEIFCAECINHMPIVDQQNAFTVLILLCDFLDRYENVDLSNSVNLLYGTIKCSEKWEYDENMESLLTILWNCWLVQIIEKDTDLHMDAMLAPFLGLVRALRKLRGENVYSNNIINAFMKQLNKKEGEK